MRIQQIMIVPLAAFGLAAGHAVQDDDATNAALVALETRVVVLETRLAQTEAYLQAQAKAAATLDKKISESVAAGFTSGINFNSREILVGAWNTRNKAAGEGLPGVASKRDGKQPEGR